jgi:dTDP-4-dehydrorhamnose 3,5-epimerase
MIVRETALPGVVVVAAEPNVDERGSFARVFDAACFRAHGLRTDFVEDSVSRNHRAGTLRGLHFQRPPHLETKLVTCIAGRVYDVVVDLRAGPTFGRWLAFTLDAASWTSLYIPAGVAHGFQTLSDDAALHYRITPSYVAHAAAGLRWDDERLAIPWPMRPSAVSARDAALPALEALRPLVLDPAAADHPKEMDDVAGGRG